MSGGSAHVGRRAVDETGKLLLDARQTLIDLAWRERTRCGHREAGIVAPPVEANLFGLVDRAHEQPHLNGEELDIGEVDLDVAGDHEALVEHSVENVDEAVRAIRRGELWQVGLRSSSAKAAERSQIDVEVLVRQTEYCLQLRHPLVELE
jgi:hypothetical protein